MNYPVDDTIKGLLNQYLAEIETSVKADFISFYGPIVEGLAQHIKSAVEELFEENFPRQERRLFFMLTTSGGLVTEVERIVNVLRHFYSEVNFVVPDYAYSAGTILCMSGDNIYMNYFSVLGPIDPQVPNKDNVLIPAQGYLDKVNEFIKKSSEQSLSEAEVLMLSKIDLADLRRYEQARELTVDLLKKWLVKYKFKNWNVHNSNPEKLGGKVSEEEKIIRAEEIATKLSNNNLWKAHGRGIDISVLEEDLRLKIENYTEPSTLRDCFEKYFALNIDYIRKNQASFFLHTRRYI